MNISCYINITNVRTVSIPCLVSVVYLDLCFIGTINEKGLQFKRDSNKIFLISLNMSIESFWHFPNYEKKILLVFEDMNMKYI